MTDRIEIGCGEIHIGDCYVWAEIYYLDSPTDYREYISNPVSQRRTEACEEFITLDNPWFSWRAVPKFLVALLTRL
jgi:hypothetical protein